jgi:hypothetical protein
LPAVENTSVGWGCITVAAEDPNKKLRIIILLLLHPKNNNIQ